MNLWSNQMLPCTPDTVYTALTWIHSISCGPGRDLLAALSMALTDPACRVVHLLCTDLPEQPEAVLRALPALAAGRRMTIFYLQHSGRRLNKNTRDYLQCLAEATSGSLSLIQYNMSEGLKKVRVNASDAGKSQKLKFEYVHATIPGCVSINPFVFLAVIPRRFHCMLATSRHPLPQSLR